MTQTLVREAYLTWEELTHGPTNQERQLLIQAIAILSTQPAFEKMTPWQVYDKIVAALQVVELATLEYGEEKE